MLSNFIPNNIKQEYDEELKTTIYYIDSIPTIIYSTKGDYARGAIVSRIDSSLTPCFIMKKGDVFAHGSSLHEVHKIVSDKFDKLHSVKERITKFKTNFPDFNIKVRVKELLDWHYYLTGSCLMGKLAVVKDNQINMDEDMFTIHEFIQFSKDKFGWEIIKQLQ